MDQKRRKQGTYSYDKQNTHHAYECDDGAFEPGLAVFDVESCFGEVAEEVWVAGEFFADCGADVAVEGGECESNGGEGAET